MKRFFFWRFKTAFIGLPFIGETIKTAAKASVVIIPAVIVHSHLVGSTSNVFYDVKDSDVSE